MSSRRTFAIVALIVAFLAPLLPAAPAAAASSGDFVSRVNGLRSNKGLGSLSVDGGMSGQAQRWAQQMADAGKISHNPNLGGTPGNWTKVGENVGVGGSVDSIFNALVNSAGHYRNMVDGGFNRIGVGVVVGSDGRIYTCHVFATFPGGGGGSSKPASGSTPAKAAPKAAPAPAKARPAAPARPAPAKAAVKATPSTTSAPAEPAPAAEAPEAAPVAEAAPVVAEPAPVPSARIVSGLAEVNSILTQG